MPARDRARRNPYDWAHQKRRAALIPAALDTLCPGDWVNGHRWRSPNCHRVMTDPRQMHLAHTIPVALGGTHGDTICCAPCNTGAGAILGNQLRGKRRHPRPRPWHSRTW